MDEYISRGAVLDIAMQYCPDDDGSCSKADADPREMLDEIEALPAADVQPQESEWQIVALRTIYDDIPYGHSYVCKNCGHTEGRSNKYCGGCGCKMIGVDYG